MTSLRVCLLLLLLWFFFLSINSFVCFLNASFLVLLLLYICNVRQNTFTDIYWSDENLFKEKLPEGAVGSFQSQFNFVSQNF